MRVGNQRVFRLNQAFALVRSKHPSVRFGEYFGSCSEQNIMDRIQVAVILLLCITSVTVATPTKRHDVTDDVTTAIYEEPTSPQEETPGHLVIVAREEEEELIPSPNGDVETPIYYRDEEELISTPVLLTPGLLMGVEEDDVDVLGGELMETANSGLVFRPQFRYRKQSRRRYNRNTRRRYRPFFGF